MDGYFDIQNNLNGSCEVILNIKITKIFRYSYFEYQNNSKIVDMLFGTNTMNRARRATEEKWVVIMNSK